LTAEDLLRSDEVLVTSTAGGIMPVTVIDGKPVGTGAPGPLTLQLRDRYWASHEDPRYSTGPLRGTGLMSGTCQARRRWPASAG
jgi:branched-chain amino acid aminotransferase